MQQLQPVYDSLTAADWKFVQDIHDLYESFVPRVDAINRKINGVSLKLVPPIPYTVRTKDGQTIQMRGGYVPISYDTIASKHSEKRAAEATAQMALIAARQGSSVVDYFTKARVKQVKNRPISLDLAKSLKGVQDVIHYIHWREWSLDANKLLNAIDEPIRVHYGKSTLDEFKEWIVDITAGQHKIETESERIFSSIARNVSRASLAFNVISAAKQITGLPVSMAIVGKKNVANSFLKCMSGRKALKQMVMDKSNLMKVRGDTFLQNLADVNTKLEDQSAVNNFLDKWSYVLIAGMQQQVDMITWYAGYQKALGEGNDEERSIQLADRWLIDSQGSGLEIDLAKQERQRGAIRLLMVFSSYMETQLNTHHRIFTAPTSLGNKLHDLILVDIVPVAMATAIGAALTIGDDDDDLAAKFTSDLIYQFIGGFVGIRELSPVIEHFIRDGHVSSNGPAGLRMLKDLDTLAIQLDQGEFDIALAKSAVNIAGDLTGAPSGAINRAITGTAALAQNKTDNPGAIVFNYRGKLDQ
jgi:hypothetical protein